jgi:hypothetical protein
MRLPRHVRRPRGASRATALVIAASLGLTAPYPVTVGLAAWQSQSAGGHVGTGER